MKLLKLAAISALVFILLFGIFSALFPSHIRVSRAIDIAADKTAILPFLKDTSRWNSWNLLLSGSREPIRVLPVTITDSLVTSHWLWKQKQFSSGMVLLEPKQGIITVQWYFDFELGWLPWHKFSGLLYDRQLGGPMQESLVKLKNKVESTP